MAPKCKITAAEFEQRYGELVARDFSEYTTAHTLQEALAKRSPPIVVSEEMLKIWFTKGHRIPAGAVRISSAVELQQQCGSFLPVLAAEHPSDYKLEKVLKERTPPVYASKGVLRQWLKRYFDAEPVDSAGHL